MKCLANTFETGTEIYKLGKKSLKAAAHLKNSRVKQIKQKLWSKHFLCYTMGHSIYIFSVFMFNVNLIWIYLYLAQKFISTCISTRNGWSFFHFPCIKNENLHRSRSTAVFWIWDNFTIKHFNLVIGLIYNFSGLYNYPHWKNKGISKNPWFIVFSIFLRVFQI